MPEQKIKVRLLRPLDGRDIGAVTTFERADADRLASYGAVVVLGPAKPPKPRKPKAKAAKAKKTAPTLRNQRAPDLLTKSAK